MQQKKYLWPLYLIITTIIISIVVQVYFNFKNYQINKQQFITEIQNSLDTATDNYYVDLAKNDNPLFSFGNTNNPLISDNNQTTWASASSNSDGKNISITVNSFGLKKDNNKQKTLNKLLGTNRFPKRLIKGKKIAKDSTLHFFETITKKDTTKLQSFIINSTSDATQIELITGLKTIYLSIANDSLDFKNLNLLFKKELKRKKIALKYQLNHYKNNHLISSNSKIDLSKNTIKTVAKSTYLKKDEKIELLFPNQTKTYLKKGLLGILLSFLLATAIIASLVYLLNIIKKQKQIAEIKNDFISNITHEFKTPITTIGLAVESIKNFNAINNNAKAEEYLDITKNQVNRLHVMVEKILETATLDSKELLLKKQPTDVINLIEKCIAKHQITTNKSIHFNYKEEKMNLNIDAFHFENAISNLLDNAIKYGGDVIKIQLKKENHKVLISVADNGTIPKSQEEKIFDKFYRIPKGNTHDIKGFGIGLYYTKKIIEKHQGSIELLPSKLTVFNITIPNSLK